MPIRNPIEWGWDALRLSGPGIGATVREAPARQKRVAAPAVRRIGIEDVREALAAGIQDFAAERTDVVFLCVLYPAIGLLLSRLVFGYGLLPLLFPLASGFALIGPFVGVGLAEMSRRRELGEARGWSDVFRVADSPSFRDILGVGLILVAILAVWLVAAAALYHATLGAPSPAASDSWQEAMWHATLGQATLSTATAAPGAPVSIDGFLAQVFGTSAGWALIVAGMAVGFVFASLVLAIGLVSFPLLLDRNVGMEAAIGTSLRAAAANPVPVAAWGAIIAGGLLLGSIPLFLGLAVVFPVLGHTTWHLYRKLVAA